MKQDRDIPERTRDLIRKMKETRLNDVQVLKVSILGLILAIALSIIVSSIINFSVMAVFGQ